MGILRSNGIVAAACAAAALVGAAAMPVAAQADTTWTLDGTFEDGATITGAFKVDPTGDLYAFNLTTTNGVGDGFVGYHWYGDYPYSSVNSDATVTNATSTSFTLEGNGSADNALIVLFANPLNQPSLGPDPIYGIGLGPLFECEGAPSCEFGGGDVRFGGGDVGQATPVTRGDGPPSAAPEPATWATMLLGFGGLGAVLRGSRRRRAPVVPTA